MEKKLKTATLCIRGGWKPQNGEPVQPPIYQSTTFKYDNTEEMAQLFDLKNGSHKTENPFNPLFIRVLLLNTITPRRWHNSSI